VVQLRCSTLIALAIGCSPPKVVNGDRDSKAPASGGTVDKPALVTAKELRAPLVPGVSVELGAGFGTFQVVNRGPTTLLRTSVNVEKRVGEVWEPTPVSRLMLRRDCEGHTELPECISIEAASTMTVAPWTGRLCMSQCPTSCRLDGVAPEGLYRIVVTSCDGARSFQSTGFTKAAPAQ
jgi:hypothetical protein